ncbi:hypothetical protein [Actinokineospora cianjurensis]|uniref:Uncharacterized protein n=1 Tax=Actinokineospora cianjurensis TaxID=585224 RepID=A0A421AYA4_9PSEU|nr:hypothetical protein [Actinokineospora cianjurensis]RLK54759.1 hypothetical protein CLV68_5145 [Actinokineospora cianjurensis]
MDFTPTPGPPRDPAARDEAIAEAVAGLDGLDAIPVAEHVDRFDAVHIALTAALASIDKV